MRPPRFIYFDLGNVLLTFDHDLACAAMGRLANAPADRVHAALFEDGLEHAYERGEISTEQFYQRLCESLGARPDKAALLHAASDMFAINAPVVPLVTGLFSAGWRPGVLSNTCEAHWNLVTDGRFRMMNDLFGVTALSFRIGAMKPEPVIFTAAAELAGAPPEDIFFVDDRAENVAAAREAGFDAVLFTTAATLTAELRARRVAMNL